MPNAKLRGLTSSRMSVALRQFKKRTEQRMRKTRQKPYTKRRQLLRSAAD